MNDLKINSLKVKRQKFSDAISYKFDNRRVTVIALDDGFGFEFRTIDEENTRRSIHIRKMNMTLTGFTLTQESSEALLFLLAESMGFKIVKRQK